MIQNRCLAFANDDMITKGSNNRDLNEIQRANICSTTSTPNIHRSLAVYALCCAFAFGGSLSLSLDGGGSHRNLRNVMRAHDSLPKKPASAQVTTQFSIELHAKRHSPIRAVITFTCVRVKPFHTSDNGSVYLCFRERA